MPRRPSEGRANPLGPPGRQDEQRGPLEHWNEAQFALVHHQ